MKTLCALFSIVIFLCVAIIVVANIAKGNVSGFGAIAAMAMAWLSYRAMRIAISDLKEE